MTTLQLSRVIPVIRQEVIAERLDGLRKEWQQEAGEDLDAVKASVGLLLADFAAICELEPQASEPVNANQKPNEALPELTEVLFTSQDQARDILKKYLAETGAPEAVLELVNYIEYATQMTASTIREVGTADAPLESAAFEIEDTIKRLAKNTAAVSSFLDRQEK